jgi:transcriptional regulator with XRE-family HTH domain
MAKPKKSEYSEQHERLGKLLLAARKAQKLKQRQVAEKLGRQQTFIAKYEGGKRHLDVVEFVTIAKAIGVDPRRIISRLLKRWPDASVEAPSPPGGQDSSSQAAK